MTSPTRILTMVLAAALAIPILAGTAVYAQSESDLRKANDALRNELRDTQLQLDAANKKIRELEAQITQLREALAAGGGSRASGPIPDLPQEPVSIDESVANASPRALFAALRNSYAETLKDLEPGTMKPDDKERPLYLRAVSTWTEKANRQFKDKITWHVRIEETSRDQTSGHYLVRLNAVDPVTGTLLGDPFTVRIDRPTYNRLQRTEKYADVSVLVLSGVLMPEVRVNARRIEPGPFETDLIGPFAEFAFSVEVMSLVPPEKEKPAEEAKPEKPTGTASAEKP